MFKKCIQKQSYPFSMIALFDVFPVKKNNDHAEMTPPSLPKSLLLAFV